MRNAAAVRTAVVALGVVALLALRACQEEGTFVAAPPDDLGAICAYHEDCEHYCVLGLQGMAPSCTRSCSAAAPCPGGYACVVRDQMGPVCVIGPCAAEADCPEGYGCDVDQGVCLHDDIPCSADGDCPAQTACNQGVCATTCESEDDCKAGFFCQYGARCVQCLSHGDCLGGYACNNGQCNAACVEDEDCRAGFACEAAACTAIVGGGAGVLGDPCTTDEECADFCYGGICTQTCDPEVATSCPVGFGCHPNHWVCTPG